jgi:hypothetical protein
VSASGRDFAFYNDDSGPGRVSRYGSLLVTGLAHRGRRGQVGGWSSSKPYTTPDPVHPETICIPGYAVSFFNGLPTSETTRSYAATYRAGPIVAAPAEQTAKPGESKSFDLGSFADSDHESGVSEYTVDVDWGDGTSESFRTSETGTIGARQHTYRLRALPRICGHRRSSFIGRHCRLAGSFFGVWVGVRLACAHSHAPARGLDTAEDMSAAFVDVVGVFPRARKNPGLPQLLFCSS